MQWGIIDLYLIVFPLKYSHVEASGLTHNQAILMVYGSIAEKSPEPLFCLAWFTRPLIWAAAYYHTSYQVLYLVCHQANEYIPYNLTAKTDGHETNHRQRIKREGLKFLFPSSHHAHSKHPQSVVDSSG